jgi:hypothetical protein
MQNIAQSLNPQVQYSFTRQHIANSFALVFHKPREEIAPKLLLLPNAQGLNQKTSPWLINSFAKTRKQICFAQQKI